MLRKLILFVFLCLVAPLAWAAEININTASVAELDTLPGIGPSKAQAIVDHRTQNGNFATIDALQQVAGIGPATYANVQALITVGAPGAPPADAPPPDAPPSDAPQPDAPADGTPEPAAPAPPTNAININAAGAAALQTLPGVGPSKAQAIVDDRAANGPFATCHELTRVAGIGEATVANIASVCAVK